MRNRTFGAVLVGGIGLLFLLHHLRADVGVFGSGPIPPPNASATVVYSTWPAPTNSFDLSLTPQQATISTDAAITNFINAAVAGQENGGVLWLTNSAATNCTLRITASGYTDVGTGARSYVVTNASQRVIAFNKNDMGYHGQSQPAF